jgi:hypothetical protein
MPDKRTVLMGDDATNGGLFMFIADREADLSAGTLYVAQMDAGVVERRGRGTLSWINLGHATSAEIEALANELTRGDIMDVKTIDPIDPTYTKINYNGTFNWVRQARHEQGGDLPRDASLRGAGRRQHGLHETGRHDGQYQGQGAVFGDVAHREVDGARAMPHPPTWPSTRPSTPARSTR